MEEGQGLSSFPADDLCFPNADVPFCSPNLDDHGIGEPSTIMQSSAWARTLAKPLDGLAHCHGVHSSMPNQVSWSHAAATSHCQAMSCMPHVYSSRLEPAEGFDLFSRLS